METIKKYKKLIMAIIFVVAILIFTKVEAFTVTSSNNIVNHNFTPYRADGTYIYYCIHRGSPYKANLPAGYSENQEYGRWCITSDREPSKPTANGGALWGTNTVKTMEYKSTGIINDRDYQDAAYVMASTYEEGVKNGNIANAFLNMDTQWALWQTGLNLGAQGHYVNGVWVPNTFVTVGNEGIAYKNFYKDIHNGTTDIYSSKVYDKTDIDSVTVEVDQNNKKYIVGPFTIEYPKGEYGTQKWSYITNIYLLDQKNNKVGEVLNNTIDIIDVNGTELRDTINNNNFPNSNQEFYVKFSSNLGDISNVKLQVDFKYLESCSASLERFEGVLKNWVWQVENTGDKCSDKSHNHKPTDDISIMTWKLKVTQGAKPQELVAFKCNDAVHGYGGHASKNYKTTSLIVAPGGVDITMKVSGQVFLDMDSGKANTGNNIMDANNEALNGVEVTLYDASNNQIITRVNEVAKYHTHTSSCYTDVAHIHSGDPYIGGGCYTKQIHTHIGSWELGGQGTCYETPIVHVHTGSPTPVKTTYTETHYHTGSASSGGGCYTKPIYHTHNSSCLSVHTHNSSCPRRNEDGMKIEWTSGVQVCSSCGDTYQDWGAKCYICGERRSGTTACDCGAHSEDPVGECFHEVVTCTQTTQIICGKTEGVTIDGYTTGCGLSQGQQITKTTVQGSGCYLKPSYHTHTGSLTSGGGCYTGKVYHQHSDAAGCYQVSEGHKHTGSCYTGGHTFSECSNCPNTEGTWAVGKICDDCGIGVMREVEEKGTLTCGKTEGQTIKTLICKKIPGVTVDSYKLNCNHNSGDLTSYELGCGRDEGAMCWTLTCTKPLYEAICNGAPTKILTCGKTNQAAGSTTITLQNSVITKKVGDKDGYYEFAGLDAMKKYYVRFVYNGIMYTNVLYNSNNDRNVSKADEISRYNHKDRETINDTFKEIGSYPSSYQIKTKVFGQDLGDYNKTYLQEDIVDIFKMISEKMVGKNTDNYLQACNETFNTLKTNNKYKSDLTELKRMIQFAADCRVASTTVQTYPLIDKFVISNTAKTIDGYTYPPIYSEDYTKNASGTITGYGRYNQLHINLGIKARPTFDLALYKDVLKADVHINGKIETYNYDARKATSAFSLGVSEQDYLNGLKRAYQNSNAYTNNLKTRPIEQDSYDIYMRTEEIANGQSSNYKADKTGQINGNYQLNNNYDNLRQNENGTTNDDRLKVYITYKLSIRNQSTVTGAITEIVDYFDTNYQFVEAYVGDVNGNKTGNVTKYDNSKYQPNTQYKSTKGAYTTIYLRPDNETRLNNAEEQYIYVKLELKGSSNDVGTLLSEKLLNKDNLTVLNLAEINGYKTYISKTDSRTQGLIDIDSKPGNLNISNIEKLTQDNIVKYPNIREMYEDDTSRAPALIYKIKESRTIEGTVFEDATGKDSNIYTKQDRVGNGIIDSSEKGIEGVIVDLVEIKNGEMQVRATTTTNASGWYGFTGFLPGNYTVRYTYGSDDNTALSKTSTYYKGLNDKSYNGQEYQSTTFTLKPEQNLGNTNYKTDSILKAKYNTNNANRNSEEVEVNIGDTTIYNYNQGYYWYTLDDKLSDATDDINRKNQVIEYSKNEYGREITNHKAEVFKSHENTQPDHITKEFNRELVNELERRTYRFAYTPLMEIEVEYATKQITGNQNKDAYIHTIKGVDFGIVERPKADLTLDQDVKHIKVTLADGTVLFDTETGINNIQWVAKGKLEEYDKKEQINIIMDDELLSGAQLEITYYLTVTNNSENDVNTTTRAKGIIDYIANNLNFDENDNIVNGKKQWQIVKKDDIQTTLKSSLVNEKLVDLSTQSIIVKATDDNPIANTNLKPGDKVTSELVVKKMLSAESSSDDLRYTNMAEIVEIDSTVGRYDNAAIPGNQKLEEQPREHDSAGASKYVSYDSNGNIDERYPQDGTIVITPPTGSNYTVYIYYAVGAIVMVILLGGIILIKKYALNSK